jgi:hypothetical protein
MIEADIAAVCVRLFESRLGSAWLLNPLLSVVILVSNGKTLRTVWEKPSELEDSGWSQIVSVRLWQNLGIDADAREAQ